MSTQQKAAALLPAVLSLEDFQLHMVNQPFRQQEGTSRKSCTAVTLFQVPSIFHKCMELSPQLVCDESRLLDVPFAALYSLCHPVQP